MMVLFRLDISLRISSPSALSRATVYMLLICIMIIPVATSVALAVDATTPACLATWFAPDLLNELMYCNVPPADLIVFKYYIFSGVFLAVIALNIVLAVICTVKLKNIGNEVADRSPTTTDSELPLKKLIIWSAIWTTVGLIASIDGLWTCTLNVDL